MYCARCKRPVPGVRNGHAVRNTAGALGAVPTLGLSLLATKSERWHCPTCGGPVRTKPPATSKEEKQIERAAMILTCQLVIGIFAAAAARSFLVLLFIVVLPWVVFALVKRYRKT